MTDAISAIPPLRPLNRTFIGSVLFIDIVGYSRCTVPDQLAMKETFNLLLAEAVQNVAASERIMVDTGDGAGIAFLGDPEDALFAALSLRDSIDAGKVAVGEPGFVRMGINLGPLKVVRDINGHTNMIGDGVNDAQRVMSFAEPGQVMVSHAYYDIISRFSRDYAQLFTYEGTRRDKHVREHEVYRFGPIGDDQALAEKLRDRSRARQNAGNEDEASAFPAASAAEPLPTPARRARPATASGSKTSRAAVIVAAIGAASVVGAVWSWHRTPDRGADASPVATLAAAPAAAAALPAATAAPAPKADEPAPAAPRPQSKASAAQTAAKEAAPADKPAEAPTPTPAPKPGIVRLAVQPWGEVYIDGVKRGVSPPLKSLNLAPGRHRIEIRNADFAPHKETLEVSTGVELTVRYVF